MRFETDTQAAIYEKVKGWIQESFEDAFVPPTPLPVFVIPKGSAVAMVEVLPWHEQDTLISIWSYVVTGATMSLDLMRFLLEQNNSINFGSFALDVDDDIRLQNSLIGSSCGQHELETAILAILEAADQYDDEIVERWGGKRAVDRQVGRL